MAINLIDSSQPLSEVTPLLLLGLMNKNPRCGQKHSLLPITTVQYPLMSSMGHAGTKHRFPSVLKFLPP
jgi:hypothetical protein